MKLKGRTSEDLWLIFFLIQLFLTIGAMTIFATIFSILDYLLPGFYFITLPISVLFFYFTVVPLLAFTNKSARMIIGQKTGQYTPTETSIWAVASTTCDIAVTLISKATFRNRFPVGVYKLFGLKCGKEVIIAGEIWDPDMIEMGSNTRIDENVILTGHTIEYGILSRGKTILGENTHIEPICVILQPNKVNSNVFLRGKTVVPRNREIDKEGVYEGVPAKFVKLRSITNR